MSYPHLNRNAFRRILVAAVFVAGLGVAGFGVVAGCAHVPVHRQGRVSQPAMLFSDSAVAVPRGNLINQIEPGVAVSGGAQAAGCTACR